METGQGHTQDDLHQFLYAARNEDGADYRQRFYDRGVKHTRLSELQRISEREDKIAALTTLRRRRSIQVDREYTLDLTGPDVVPRIGPHFIDFTLFVGDKIGLGTALPHRQYDPTWSMRLTLNHATDLWPSADSRYLPFNPMGRMLKIGTRLQENVWLAMVPKSYLNHDHADNIPGHHPILNATTSALKSNHALMITMFFAYALSKMHYRDIHCNDTYPEPLTREEVKRSTDILAHLGEQRRTLVLTLPVARRLDEKMKTLWRDWVHAAPASWKQDRFIKDNVPITVSMVYGQNQEILSNPNDAEDEGNVWEMDHDYSEIRQFTFSTASLLRYYLVTEWTERDVDEILESYPHVFTETIVPGSNDLRQPVEDLHDLDLLDDDGREINIYDEEGYRIPRRFPEDATPHGLWVDLNRAHELFDDDIDDLLAPRHTRFSVYPQAFLKRFGNLQSKCAPAVYQHLIMHLNQDLAMALQNPEDSDGNNDDQDRAHYTMAISVVGFQAYNELSHRFRDEPRFHVTQTGLITSAISCARHDPPGTVQKWMRRVDICRDKLPHLRFEDKISTPSQPQALRNEITLTVHIRRLKAEFRDGASIYNKIISRVTRYWSHPRVLNAFKTCVIAFKPDLIPKIYKWTTYPITTLLESLWQQVQPVLNEPGGAYVKPYIVELVAMLERVLNFAHTGNAQVLVRGLMDRAWLSLGCLIDGCPCVSDDFIGHQSLGTNRIVYHTSHWPVDPSTHLPLMASKRVLELTYGHRYYRCYQSKFAIEHAVNYLPRDIYTQLPNEYLRKAFFAIEIGLRAYITDVKELISTCIRKELADGLSSPDENERALALDRKRALDTWLDQDLALAYSNTALPLLIRAISRSRDTDAAIPSASIGAQTVDWLAELIIKRYNRDHDRSTRRPPFIKGGAACMLLGASLSHARRYARNLGIQAGDINQHVKDYLIYSEVQNRCNV
ncbi:hypothetical protein HD554DRAFT_2177974 [Boletus coccyginus]|nr:hypothetical protein HD554DRAFT_2177974 [Boletus coccyginus]